MLGHARTPKSRAVSGHGSCLLVVSLILTVPLQPSRRYVRILKYPGKVDFMQDRVHLTEYSAFPAEIRLDDKREREICAAGLFTVTLSLAGGHDKSRDAPSCQYCHIGRCDLSERPHGCLLGRFIIKSEPVNIPRCLALYPELSKYLESKETFHYSALDHTYSVQEPT